MSARAFASLSVATFAGLPRNGRNSPDQRKPAAITLPSTHRHKRVGPVSPSDPRAMRSAKTVACIFGTTNAAPACHALYYNCIVRYDLLVVKGYPKKKLPVQWPRISRAQISEGSLCRPRKNPSALELAGFDTLTG
jgi:hypothetical protein